MIIYMGNMVDRINLSNLIPVNNAGNKFNRQYLCTPLTSIVSSSGYKSEVAIASKDEITMLLPQDTKYPRYLVHHGCAMDLL
jgi:hypothetical protein